MKSSALSLLLCLLLLGGCSVPATQVQAAPTPAASPIATPSPAPTATPAFAVPECLDPLGVTKDPALRTEPAIHMAEKYGAQAPALPGIYEVPGYILGALEARLIIKTENGKVTQVAAKQAKEAMYPSAFKEVYLSIVEELGPPDEALGTDIYRNRAFVPISPDSVLEHPTEIKARWYLEDRTLEFGEPAYGNTPMYWYLAVYTDELDRFSMYGYDWANDCCPHDAGTYYDPLGIYKDPELFTADAETILERYGAQETYQHLAESTSYGEYPYPFHYIKDGLEVMGVPAYLEFSVHTAPYDRLISQENTVRYADYYLLLQDETPAEICQLYTTMAELLDTVAERNDFNPMDEDLPWTIYDEELYESYAGVNLHWRIGEFNPIFLAYCYPGADNSLDFITRKYQVPRYIRLSYELSIMP